jgi:type IV pilus assembly protein PilN
MTEFNLLPWREWRCERNKQRFVHALLGIVLGAVLLVFGGGYVLRQNLATQQLRNAALRQQLEALEPSLTTLRALRGRSAEWERRTVLLHNLDVQRSYDALVLDELPRTLPSGAHYTALTREGMALRLSGMATGAELTALMRAFAVSPRLASPQLREIATPHADAADRSPFVLSVSLRDTPEVAP